MAPPAPTKELRCIHCAKTFGRVEHLKRHELTHSGDKPYRCSVCPKAFVRRDALQRHERTHSNTPSLLQRGARACGRCASAKARCSGDEPACERCRERNLQCSYPEIRNHQPTLMADLSNEDNAVANNGYGDHPQLMPSFDSSRSAAIPTANSMTGALPPQQPELSTSPDFWDPGILSTPNWLDALDCDFNEFTFPSDPCNAASGIVPSSPTLQIQKQRLSATGTSPGSSSRVVSFASAASSTLPSEDDGDSSPGEYYVGGQHGRLPRVEKRPTSTSVNASAHTVPTAAPQGFRLDYRPRGPPDSIELPEISDELYVQIVTQLQRLCLQSLPMWPKFKQQSALLKKTHFEQLLSMYWKSFHPIVPFLHSSGKVPNDHRLVVAMCAIGSHFAEQSTQFVDSMHEFAKRLLLSGNEVLPQRTIGNSCASASLLQFVGRTWSATESTPATGEEIVKGFDAACQNYEIAKRSCEPEDMNWKSWRDRESALRLAYAAFLLDAMAASQYHTRPILGLADIKLRLPCSERLWDADSEAEWQARFQFEPPSPSLQEALQQLFIDKRMPRDLSEYARIVIVHGLYHWLWDIERHYSNPLFTWEPTAKRQSSIEVLPKHPVWLPSVPAFARWQNSACDALDILHWQATAAIGQASGLEHPGVCHLHFARVVLLAPGGHIVQLARSMVDGSGNEEAANVDRQYVQRWAVQHQYKARLAAIHAGVLFWHLRRNSVDAFYEGPAIAQAALMLWAFGTFAPNTGSRSRTRSAEQQTHQQATNGHANTPRLDEVPVSSIILLDRPADDNLAQRFIRQGHAMQAHITGVGNLFADQGPSRVLFMACRLLASLKCWGACGLWHGLLKCLAEKVA